MLHNIEVSDEPNSKYCKMWVGYKFGYWVMANNYEQGASKN